MYPPRKPARGVRVKLRPQCVCRVKVQCVSFLSADSRAEVLGNGAEGADGARGTKRSGWEKV